MTLHYITFLKLMYVSQPTFHHTPRQHGPVLGAAYLVVHADSQVVGPNGQEGWLCGYGDAPLTTLAHDIHDCQLLQAGAVGQGATPSAADHRNGCQVCV